MVLGKRPSSVDASTGPEAVLGPPHDRKEEQEAVSDAQKGAVYVAVDGRPSTDHSLHSGGVSELCCVRTQDVNTPL